jgi:putative glycosyltransferase
MEEKSETKVVLTVIIPAYNAEMTIESCIQSLLVQTYKAKEIIVVDDGSKDDTLHILTKLAESNKTIKIIHQKNKGVSAARNTALNNVSSETTHICFVDADDIVKPDFLSFFAENIEKGKLIIQGFIKRYKNITENILYNKTENILKQLVQEGDFGHIFDKCFDIHIIRKYNLHFNEQFTFAEDEAFVLDYMQYIPNIKYINVAQYEYIIPTIEKSYSKDNNMGMYFYCLSKMANICQILNLPLHDIYKNRLYRCGKQFFKPSNFKRNTTSNIKSYFSNYISDTQSIPIFFSKWHFTIVVISKLKIEGLYIKWMSKILNR